jgi:hypothetical protein
MDAVGNLMCGKLVCGNPVCGKLVCTICGDEKSGGQVWFLLAENHWEDKLKILCWHERLAHREGIHRACCASHVQELVVHWMTTGSLDYPFASAAPMLESSPPWPDSVLPMAYDIDTRGARQIGELAVHRESIGRALSENPESLQVILDELLEALEREATGVSAEVEFEEDELISALVRQV